MATSKNGARLGAYYGVGFAAAIAAAGAAYFLDPQSGRRRRALLRDRASRITHETQDFLAKAGRDARQRAYGAWEKSAGMFRSDVPDDGIVEERIRAELGRLSAHPRAIEVSCSEGLARLRGDILEKELATVLHGVRRVHGVRQVVNEMRIRTDTAGIPALQGGNGMRPAPRFEYLQENWSPAPRLLAGAAGLAIVVAGLTRRSVPGLAAAAGGATLLGRSIWNRPLTHRSGVRANAGEVEHSPLNVAERASLDVGERAQG